MKKMKALATHISAAILLSITAQTSQAAIVDMAEYQDWDGVAASISSEDKISSLETSLLISRPTGLCSL